MTTLKPSISQAVKEQNPTRLPHIQSPKRILIVAGVLGVLADLLIFGQPLGFGLFLFVVLGLGSLARIGQLEEHTAVRRNLWLVIPLLFFAAMIFIRANQFLTTLNLLAVLTLLAFLVFFWRNGRVSGLNLLDMALLPLRVAGNSAVQAPPVVTESVDMTVARRHGRRSLLPVLRGLALAMPVLLVFTFLLIAADTLFAHTMESIFSWNIFGHLFEALGHGVQIVIVAVLVMGGLVFALESRHGRDDRGALNSALQTIPTHFSLGLIETTTILLSVNALFALFVGVQFSYLFGGSENINIEGFTYAEYARRGFFELLAVVLLSLVLILGLNWLTRRESKVQIQFFNLLSSLLIFFVLIMLVSAFRRMMLYEAAYGYTFLRLTVYTFMIWLGFVLVWFLFTLWRKADWFALGVFLAAVGFMVTLNLLNPDAFVAQRNLERYVETGKLDAVYLTSLSEDATAQLIQGTILTEGDTTEQMQPSCSGYTARIERVSRDCMATPSLILAEEINGRAQQMSDNTNWQAWQSFNLSRWLAFAQLQVAAE